MNFFSNHDKGSKRNKTYIYLTGLIILCTLAIYIINLFELDKDVVYSPTLILITVVIFLFGNLAPKIPYNRTLGLRLPWTVNHEPTWRYAHRMVGYCSIPIMPILVVGLLMNSDIVYGVGILVWVCIPSITSLIYYINWHNGKIVD